METIEDYQREETSKQVYKFYNHNKLKYRKSSKEFDENEVEVDDNTTQDIYIKEREYGESDTLDQPTRKRKHEDKEPLMTVITVINGCHSSFIFIKLFT